MSPFAVTCPQSIEYVTTVFWYWCPAYAVPRHCFNQWWLIINWVPVNKFQMNLSPYTDKFNNNFVEDITYTFAATWLFTKHLVFILNQSKLISTSLHPNLLRALNLEPDMNWGLNTVKLSCLLAPSHNASQWLHGSLSSYDVMKPECFNATLVRYHHQSHKRKQNATCWVGTLRNPNLPFTTRNI